MSVKFLKYVSFQVPGGVYIPSYLGYLCMKIMKYGETEITHVSGTNREGLGYIDFKFKDGKFDGRCHVIRNIKDNGFMIHIEYSSKGEEYITDLIKSIKEESPNQKEN